MKFLTTVAVASALVLAAGAACAADPNDKGDKNTQQQHHTTGNGQTGGSKGGSGGTSKGTGGPSGNHGSGTGAGPAFQAQGGGGGGAGNQFQHRSQGGPGFAAGGGHGTPGFTPGNHPLRGRDNGRVWYNADLFPHFFHPTQRFQIGAYVYPRGWYANNWYYGQYLPYGWYASNYYLDWGYLGLQAPPIGCEWVRVGPDAVLVDVWTGEVLSVAHGMFW